MLDSAYDHLVASHGSAVPARDRIRLHDCQLPALDSLLRVMREEGINRDVRVTGIFSTASGQTKIDIEFTMLVEPGARPRGVTKSRSTRSSSASKTSREETLDD